MRNRFTRTGGRALLALGLTGAGLAGVVAVAGPASAATSCDFDMVSLEARNLQTDNGSQKDYVWLQVEDRWFPSGGDGVMYTLGVTHTDAAFGYPKGGFGSSGIEVRLVL